MELKRGLISGIFAAIALTGMFSILMNVTKTGEFYRNYLGYNTPVAICALFVGMFMGLIYSVINSAIPGIGIRKGLNYGFMVWLLAGFMWPIMIIPFAPAYIWILELISGLISYPIAGAVMAIIYEKLPDITELKL
jgi:hypothetical protein